MKKAAIRLCALIKPFSGVRNHPAQAGWIAPLLLELVGAARHYVTPYTKSLERRIDGVNVKSSIAHIYLRHYQKIKVAVWSIAASGAAAEKPDFLGIERAYQSAYDFAERVVLGCERTAIRRRR
jgi:hypothetical protein